MGILQNFDNGQALRTKEKENERGKKKKGGGRGGRRVRISLGQPKQRYHERTDGGPPKP
jgi:hypothetical protein